MKSRHCAWESSKFETRVGRDGAKKNELAQNICASSIQYSICVVGYWTWKPPTPPRGPAFQPVPLLKGSRALVASHHTAVVPIWDGALEVVTTTQYVFPFGEQRPCRTEIGVRQRRGCSRSSCNYGCPKRIVRKPSASIIIDLHSKLVRSGCAETLSDRQRHLSHGTGPLRGERSSEPLR